MALCNRHTGTIFYKSVQYWRRLVDYKIGNNDYSHADFNGTASLRLRFGNFNMESLRKLPKRCYKALSAELMKPIMVVRLPMSNVSFA